MASNDRTRTHRAGRKARRLVAGLAVVGASLAAAAHPASAISLDGPDALVFVPYKGQTTTVWRKGATTQPVHFAAAQAIEGNFSGVSGSDVLYYNPGPGPDGILHVTPVDPAPTTSFLPVSVSGTFTPLVGDFNHDGLDDILWYAPGAAADHLWTFGLNGSHTDLTLSINGSYRPVVTNVDHQSGDDVIWYGPGSSPDSIWLFAGAVGQHTSKPVAIGGDYQLLAGRFGYPNDTDATRVVFFNPHGADYVWTFDGSAGHTSSNFPSIEGAARPVVGRFLDTSIEQILFYRPGSAAEQFIGFSVDGTPQQLEAPAVNGSYDPSVGDFDGNGYDDIAWSSFGKATLWKFDGGGYSQQTITTNTTNTTTAVTHDNDSITA